MVLTQPGKEFMEEGLTLDRFHTTMVLTQRPHARRMEKPQSWFPYHYGSYKSSPPLTVQDHGPVHRKDQRPDPEQELFRMTK